ncbi:hypothetical protein BsIDN1_11440 [Bacillus safensis]|uniref:Uncharacterized protein n=1 Tax=Bacillus safensis TaxID=561879 RepID=A0A5S9M7L7_BACIA|nr:hypothetical protein BsIDN1_11440 [Bacillus safensis]
MKKKETCQVKQETAAGNREKLSIHENESIRSNIEQLTIELSEQKKEFNHFILDEKQKRPSAHYLPSSQKAIVKKT